MNKFILEGVSPGGARARVWGCGQCMRVCIDEAHADRCCTCHYCKQPLSDDDLKRHRSYHQACSDKSWAERRAACIDKAEKLESWDGGVFWGDAYFESLEDAVEQIDDQCEPKDRPEWLYVAKRCPPRKLDAESVLQNYLDDVDPENLGITLAGQEEFAAACDAFNKANENIQWFEEDAGRMVRVPEAAE